MVKIKNPVIGLVAANPLTNIFVLLFLFFCSFSALAQLSTAAKEAAYYQIKKVPIPDDIVLEVGGLAFDENGVLAVSTRRGEVWRISQPGSANPKFSRYAHGLHEPLGLAYVNGGYYLTQRGELSYLKDNNNDGKADSYKSILTWPLDGNYHEYSYGPLMMPNGNMIIALNLGWVGRGISNSKWRGWMLQVTPEGEMTPIATGMRSPAGFGFNAAGDLFYTENQGDWVGSGRMTHVEVGDFVGNPEGLKWADLPGSPVNLRFNDIQDSLGLTLYEYSKKKEGIKPPSVWFPHTLMGISTSGLTVIPDGFGPFAGQLLVGDQGHSKLMRVYQEKVNGVYQGASFPFREGFSSGILRIAWGPDKSLYVGMTSRGWSSTGPEPYGLERLVWNGKIPFEIKTINARPDGFELSFTQPVNRSTAANPESYKVTDFTYKYHHFYGSPPIQKENRAVFKVEVAQDGLSARLFVEGLRPGFIYEIRPDGVKSSSGTPLLHEAGYYTLNEIPEGEKLAHAGQQGGTATAKTVNIKSAKRITEMPSSWANGPDETFTIGTVPGLKYDIEEITVKVGSKIKFTLNNNDDMLHNILIVKPNTADLVGTLALKLGLDGEDMAYVPEVDEVLHHTTLLQPHSSESIYFIAPTEPGEYQYVCTFPGHFMTMRGVLKVVK